LIVHYTRISDPVFSANLYHPTEEGVFLIFSILGSLLSLYQFSFTHFILGVRYTVRRAFTYWLHSWKTV